MTRAIVPLFNPFLDWRMVTKYEGLYGSGTRQAQPAVQQWFA